MLFCARQVKIDSGSIASLRQLLFYIDHKLFYYRIDHRIKCEHITSRKYNKNYFAIHNSRAMISIRVLENFWTPLWPYFFHIFFFNPSIWSNFVQFFHLWEIYIRWSFDKCCFCSVSCFIGTKLVPICLGY